eukprot:m.54181 g.54181  ORF g.54181 m.54181 type:complete len:266 (+) comp12440_c0_seq3:28-825(+)
MSVYGGGDATGCDGRLNAPKLREHELLPIRTTLHNSKEVELDYIRDTDVAAAHLLFNDVIASGVSWPFTESMTVNQFKAYFLSHDAFIVRDVETDAMIGLFYIKPNYPGRSSHICNGGFITPPTSRGLGIGRLMGACFVQLAKALGYKASYFNLVYVSNKASVRLWDSLGFTRLCKLPRAASLAGFDDLVDAYGVHRNLEDVPDDYDPLEEFRVSRLRPHKGDDACAPVSLTTKLWSAYRDAAPLFLLPVTVVAATASYLAWKRN